MPAPRLRALRLAWVLTVMVFLGLWAWALRPTEPVVREKLLTHIEPIGEILYDQSAGQTFFAPYNGLYRIEVELADYGRRNSHDVNFRLSTTPGDPAAPILHGFPAEAIRGDVWYIFEFDPIPDSAGRTYYFQLDAPAADLGRAITAYLSSMDAYPEGTAYRPGQPIPGDLILKAHFKTDTWTAATFWLTELKAHKPGVWDQTRLYVGLLAAYLTLVVVLVHHIASKADTG